MDKLLEIFKREDDCFSLIRIMAGISFLILIILTLGEYFGRAIQHYNEFATFTGGVAALSIGGKYVDFKGMTR